MRLDRVIVLALAVTVLACGVKSRNQDVPDEKTFSDMTYKSDGQNFSYLSPSSPLVLSDEGHGKKVYGDMRLYLYKSKKYNFVYEEALGCISNGKITSYVIASQLKKGQWRSHQKGQAHMISLGDLGDGYKPGAGEKGIHLVFKSEMGRSGKSAREYALDSTSGPMDLPEDGTYSRTVMTYQEASNALDKSGHCDSVR